MANRIQLPAIKGVIGNWIYYQTVMPFHQVVDRIDNDHSIREYKSLDDHLQRDLSKRSKKIAEYLLREDTRFFNCAIIGLMGGNPNWYNFSFAPSSVPAMELNEFVLNTIGILELSGEEQFFSIDGQHRIDGIKQALKNNPDRFYNDELSLIIVAHEDSPKGKVRTRRLFSEINTKALKVSGLDDLITNEDNPVDINARKIYAEFEPFGRDEFILLSAKSNIKSEAKELTTILNLKEINKILYERDFKFKDVRPDDLQISRLYDLTIDFWTKAVSCIPTYKEVLLKKEGSVSKYRNRDGGSMLFRPVGIVILAQAYVNWNRTDDFWDSFNKIDPDLNGRYWKDILWDNAKKSIKKVSPKFLREYTKYLLQLDCDEQYISNEYRKLKGIETVTNMVVSLPAPP